MPLRKQILVVEDNELNREILTGILEDNYRVLEAEHGQQALDILEENRGSVDLILLDVMMPVMDGFTFLDNIARDPELSHIPVIVTTQGTSEEDELAALNHGATDFVPKPYRPQIILHRVAALIKLHETAAMVNQLQYDRLTGLYTREFFYRKVRETLEQNPREEFVIICSNVEHFKLINDIFGTQQGDHLLVEIAHMAQEMVGETGFVGRLNADRFLCFQRRSVVMGQMSRMQGDTGKNFSELLRNVVMRWGIYEVTDRSIPVEQMCDRAVLAADSIKEKYDQFYATYDDSLRSKLLREQAITTAMEEALEQEQFLVYLQPKFSLKNNCMAGAEALVRWIHPEWGFMSPGEFIPLFEKNGFIFKLDQYIWEHVCAQLAQWQKLGYPMLPVSVNVSRADMFHDNLADMIFDMTRRYGIDPCYLHLEITESAYAENPDQIISTVKRLRELGFIVEMDDFGSGYSSLNMLSQMSLDILKLDMKFIQSELAKPVGQSLLGNVIGMAHQLHLSVVAEGVETREQLGRLRDEECDYVQGYYCARPMPLDEYEGLLKNSRPRGDAAEPKKQRSDSKQNLLVIVDEDPAYRRMVQEVFASWFEVLEAERAEDALELLQQYGGARISALILSMNLPDMGAVRVMDMLKNTPDLWQVPVMATIPTNQCRDELPLAYEADEFLCKCHPSFDLYRRVQRMVSIRSFRQKENMLRNEAVRDPLTDLLNRRGLHSAVTNMKEKDMPLAVCVFDLDDLKTVNDTFGHEQGDQLLVRFADVLCAHTRAEDVKCRYGGDEFVVVLRHMSDAKAACGKIDSICQAFRELQHQAGLPGACSAGITMCESADRLTPDLVVEADRALYRAKKENKGSCCLWDPEED